LRSNAVSRFVEFEIDHFLQDFAIQADFQAVGLGQPDAEVEQFVGFRAGVEELGVFRAKCQLGTKVAELIEQLLGVFVFFVGAGADAFVAGFDDGLSIGAHVVVGDFALFDEQIEVLPVEGRAVDGGDLDAAEAEDAKHHIVHAAFGAGAQDEGNHDHNHGPRPSKSACIWRNRKRD